MKKANWFLLLMLFAMYNESSGQMPIRAAKYSYQKPETIGDGITTEELKNVGLDSSAIISLTKLILADSFANVHSLLIVIDGKLVYENYFAGKDQKN